MKRQSHEEYSYDMLMLNSDICTKCNERVWFDDFGEEFCQECEKEQEETK